jgi:hypothetical protein
VTAWKTGWRSATMRYVSETCGRTPGGLAVSSTTAAELPNLATLTREQKQRLLALLIKDELDRQPIPMLIPVRIDGQDLGHFRPKIHHPAKTTLPPVPEGYWEEVAKLAENPGKTLTLEELQALEASGADESLLR